MPTEWNYHADGVGTAVSTTQDLDGSLKSVTIQLDTFRVRGWTDEELEDDSTRTPGHLSWDEKEQLHYEHDSGAHATFKFRIDTGSATLEHIKPEDGDVFKPEHMAILPAVERVLANINGVDVAATPLQNLASYYDQAESVHIERLD